MRRYIIVSAIIFALVFLAHVARAFAEGVAILGEPIIILSSAISLGMAIWAAVLLIRRPR